MKTPKYAANYLLFIEYDGTGFSGWQAQPGCRTVQTEIEKAARKVLRCPVRLTVAGRTDAGVHALRQAANLMSINAMEPYRLRYALNSVLARDIAVVAMRKVDLDFHARFDALEKVYRYRIWNRPYRSVWNKYAWHIPDPLDIEKMRKAAAYCLGKHDFNAFYAAGGTQEDTIVDIKSINIRRENGFILLDFRAGRFLYKMVRNLVGTFVDAGRGRIEVSDVKAIVASCDRKNAGRTAPPHGLFLKKIVFK